jgi:hypothetical protein
MTNRVESLLTLRAGTKALATLREHGFSADRFSTLVGASGGPKWLVLSQLDRVLARRIVGGRTTPLELLGSSIGSFRHACLAQADPLAALERFEAAYMEQSYRASPSPAEVSEESRRILGVLLGAKGAVEIVANPLVRSHVLAARVRAPVGGQGPAFRAILGLAALGNVFSRSSLSLFLERALFSSSRTSAPRFHDIRTRGLGLCEENLEDVVLASGSIPLVMEGVRDVAHAPPGLYLDGGIIDYHFDFRFEVSPGLVLFPHFFDGITPGWFDKALPWRRVPPAVLERVVMIAPSREFIGSLPGARVPDRGDFNRFPSGERQRRWKEVVERCRALADALEELLVSGRIVEALRPFGEDSQLSCGVGRLE